MVFCSLRHRIAQLEQRQSQLSQQPSASHTPPAILQAHEQLQSFSIEAVESARTLSQELQNAQVCTMDSMSMLAWHLQRTRM